MFEMMLFLLLLPHFTEGISALNPELDLDVTSCKLRPNFASHTAAPVSWQAYRGGWHPNCWGQRTGQRRKLKAQVVDVHILYIIRHEAGLHRSLQFTQLQWAGELGKMVKL